MNFQILDYSTEKGLVATKNLKEAKNNEERLYIADIQKLKAQAVLFRRFYRKDDDQSPYHSEPSVCIFNEEDFPFNSKEHIELHAALWSSGKNEIYIIAGKTRVDIINARKPATKGDKNDLSVTELRLADIKRGQHDERFSARLFGNGTFWEQGDFIDQLDEKSSPYLHLLTYLLTVRKHFLEIKNQLSLKSATVDKLLVVSILVKFLEEIKDDDGKHTLRSIYKKYKVKNFAEAIQKRFTIDIFNELAEEFNGKIFDNFSEIEKKKIPATDLTLLSEFLSADINLTTRQYFLWEQYSFNHLPAEVISAIYENFIQAEAIRVNNRTEKGVVYTPIHLVNFLVDEVMPLDKPEKFKGQVFRVLDPACGSGVFLVAAYKRLLQWWAINNSSENKIEYPNSRIAQKILEENIFGVDVKGTAILVSMLGLTTALLDRLSPKEIWNKLKLKDLSEKNLKQDSFFIWASSTIKNKAKFNLVIGNPPFNPETGLRKQDVLNQQIISSIDFKHKKIPNENFALHFFEGSMSLADKTCLILPANVLLYNKSAHQYRQQIFKDFTVSSIFDFTHLRRNLFHRSADTPVLAVIVVNKPSPGTPIEHVVVKRMISTERKLRFEIDYYDIHTVPLDWALDPDKQFVWKTNLLGGGRLFHLIYRLSSYPSFKSFIEKKKKENSEWSYSVGYKLVGQKRKPNIEYIFNKESIITETFDEDEKFETFIEKNRNFAEPRDEKIYRPPHLILKVNLGKKNIPIHFSEKYLCFKDKLVGLHAPVKEKSTLLSIYNLFKEKHFSALSKLWILSTSAEALVNLETTCKKEDLDSLPYIESHQPIKLSFSEQILQDDILSHLVHLGKAINKNASGIYLTNKVTQSQLVDYGNALCKTLNEIYGTDKKEWQLGNSYQTPIFTICQIGFGKKNGLPHKFLDKLDEVMINILRETVSKRGIVYKRVFRIYKHQEKYDCVYLIKPHSFRYWLKSIALKDADDTFHDLKNAGF